MKKNSYFFLQIFKFLYNIFLLKKFLYNVEYQCKKFLNSILYMILRVLVTNIVEESIM